MLRFPMLGCREDAQCWIDLDAHDELPRFHGHADVWNEARAQVALHVLTSGRASPRGSYPMLTGCHRLAWAIENGLYTSGLSSNERRLLAAIRGRRLGRRIRERVA